jgi:hypothetical protein
VRVRTLGAAAAAVVALAGLAGCKTNVGTAAVIDGQRVTESDVSHYLTAQSQPVTERNANNATVQISPRSFVVAQLINEQLGFKVLAAIPSVSDVTAAQLDARLQNDLGGKSVTAVAEQLGLHGYTEAFYRIILRVQEISGVLRNEQSNGVDITAAFSKIKFPVSVSPRYGRWDSTALQFIAGATVPGYLELQSGAVAPQDLSPVN